MKPSTYTEVYSSTRVSTLSTTTISRVIINERDIAIRENRKSYFIAAAKMVNYYIYAKDCSGSTEGVNYYHINGLKTLEKFKEDVKKIQEELFNAEATPTETKIIYLHWGDKCNKVDELLVSSTYKNCKGDYGGTRPEGITKYIKKECLVNKEDNIKLLYIITDGEICDASQEECFKINKDIFYDFVVFHAFNENLEEINLSVASSFFKSRCEAYCNNELHDRIDIANEFDYDKVNINNFAVEKHQLKSYIKLKFINKYEKGAGGLRVIDKLKKLRDRLFNEFQKNWELNKDNNAVCLETKDKKLFQREFAKTEWYKDIHGTSYAAKVDVEKSISALINYVISDVKSYSFDVLKFDKKFDKSVEEEQMVDVNLEPEQEIEFPDVILDDDKGIPVVILTKINLMDKIIFHGERGWNQLSPASFSKFNSTMECPLFLMNDEDMSDSIGYFYTLNVYKQLLVNNTKFDPRTRRPFEGGLVLTDTKHFDKYNDYILSATYFDGKKIKYNIGLFYYVLWKNCEKKEWMDRNVVEQFKKYAMQRISETTCKIGLSSLPLDPDQTTTLLTALWYCVELSTCIFKNDPQNFKQERLRHYYGVARYMIEILKWFEYDVDMETIEKRRTLINYVMTLKKIQKPRDKAYHLLEKIFKTVEGFLVSEIEHPSNLYNLNYLKFNHKEMLPDSLDSEKKVHLNDFVHLMHFEGDLEASKAGEGTVEICEKTFRPFFAIDQKKSFYTELVNMTKKVVISNDNDKDKVNVTYEAMDSLEFDKVLSLYKLFIDCVEESEKYPTLSEYVQYILKKKKFYDDLVTVFPSNVYFGAKYVYECYQKILKKVTVKQFVTVCKSHVNRTDRIKAEERFKFSSDNEIDEFISREELRVKLKKKT